MNDWAFAKHRSEEGIFSVRRRALRDPAERFRFPVAIWITWPLREGAADLASMVAFEDAVRVATDATGQGMLIAVVTAAQEREWLWYATDATAFVAELRAALADHPIYPFEVRAWDDPAWRAASELSGRSAMH